MKKVRWILLSSIFISELALSACLEQCPSPDKQIVSGVIDRVRVVKIKNPPSDSDSLKCEITLNQPKIWKGEPALTVKIYTSWPADFCKNKYKTGEKILALGSDYIRDWIKETAGKAKPLYYPKIYQGIEAKSRLEYLKSASKDAINNTELYCIHVLRRVCLPLSDTPIKVKSEHPAILSITSQLEAPEKLGAMQLEYEIDESGKLIKRSGIRTANLFHSLTSSHKDKIISSLEFSELEKHKGRCFFVTLIVDEKLLK